MIQKNDAALRRRGRPRTYDPQTALLQARDSFWRSGYAATSLDDLTTATGMNRPSLYAAFGNKRALYLKALAQYWTFALAEMRADLAGDLPLDEALMRVYDGALSIYFSGDGGPRGCFLISTAVTEAVGDTDIRNSLAASFLIFDTEFESRFQDALERGELKKKADPAALAVLATATMHTIAVRARAGVPRAGLRAVAREVIGVICG